MTARFRAGGGWVLVDSVVLGIIFLLLGPVVGLAYKRIWYAITGKHPADAAPLSESEKRERAVDWTFIGLLASVVLIVAGIASAATSAIIWIQDQSFNVLWTMWSAIGLEYLGIVLTRITFARLPKYGREVGTRLVTMTDDMVPKVPTGARMSPGGADEEARDGRQP